jgi:hypothetical protein
MKAETIGKVCELCGTPDDLQVHHTSYIPETTKILCVPCHRKQHNGHGVGESTASAMFDSLIAEFIDLHDVVLNRRCVAVELGISYTTAYEWDRKIGFLKYIGSVNSVKRSDVKYMSTPILKSTRDRLKELQEENGHDNTGETIGMLLEHHERYMGLTE